MPLINLKSDLTWYSKTPPGDAGPKNRIARAATDTLRISKYLTSPSGLLFIGKQVGLQLTNPNTENLFGLPNFNPITNANKQFTPINLLANVAGAGVGIHVARHGLLPFAEVFNYEATVVRNRTTPDTSFAVNNNRLVRLKNELIDSKAVLPKSKLANKVLSITQQIQSKLGYSGTVINTLTAVTGPKSLLGVGATTFRTAEKRNPATGTQRYRIASQYASALGGYNKTNQGDDNNNNKNDIDEWSLSPNTRTDTQFSTIGDKYLEITADKKIPEVLEKPTERTSVNNYATVAYGRIPKDKTGDYTRFNNFLLDNVDAKDYTNLITGPILESKYSEENVVKRFGYLNYGSKNQDIDTSDYKFETGKAKDDIINFKIHNTRFRAYIDNISDSFSPSIETQQPLGSPISAVRYTGIERSISVSFKIAVLSQRDLTLTYNKMKALQETAYFRTDNESFYSIRPVTIIIGSLYNFRGYVESVSFDWDSEMPWDIRPNSQVPLYCNVSVDFKYIAPRPGFAITGDKN